LAQRFDAIAHRRFLQEVALMEFYLWMLQFLEGQSKDSTAKTEFLPFSQWNQERDGDDAGFCGWVCF
jgi:hypothetical protein